MNHWTSWSWRRFTVAWLGLAVIVYALLRVIPWPPVPGAAVFVAWLQLVWLPPVMYLGRARSLRDVRELKDLLPVADVLEVRVPAHPTWWRERIEPYRRLSAAILVASAGALAFALIPLGYVDSPSAWVPILLYTWCTGSLVLVGFLQYARAQRERAFRRDVRSALDRTTGRDLAALRDDHVKELEEVRRRLADKRRLEALYIGSEVEFYDTPARNGAAS